MSFVNEYYRTRTVTYRCAIREALQEEMRRNPLVFILGEDIARHGGGFGVTQQLWEEFGDSRVRNTPISENTIVGVALGAAMTGCRPVVEFMFMDFSALAMDQICNGAAKIHYMSGGQLNAPLVIRCPQGGLSWKSAAAHHSQSLEAWYVHVPGLVVVFPSTPYDAKGLLKTAIRDDNPVIFIEHKALYDLEGVIPDGDFTLPLGRARVVKKGEDVTVVASGYMVHYAIEAEKQLASLGIDLEIIDPRTLKPLDEELIVNSVRKTHRVVLVQEACRTAGVAAEWGMRIQDTCFDWLDAPIVRVAGEDVPTPYANSLEKMVWPNPASIVDAVLELIPHYPDREVLNHGD
ncbi:MAG: alpha-ketoacid dehydrogenase subunit beta [Anaerolineales bacterium]|nr:alpha-ketoacid dehydrogenase subunit beta [Anaerolineales bacterium]